MQNWTVPSGVNSVNLIVSGAEGGQGFFNNGNLAEGGQGGIVSGTRAVTPGQILYLYVGGKGEMVTDGTLSGGGWNGGGDARGFSQIGRGAGGGASDVRIGGTSLNDRIIVGAGGGGACLDPYDGGAGGGDAGAKGVGGTIAGQGGIQSGGGPGGVGAGCGSGEFGVGGSAGTNSTCAGGGSGWYGGGSGCGAGGGSSYIGGVTNGTYMPYGISGHGKITIVYSVLNNDVCLTPEEIICDQTITGSTIGAGQDFPSCSNHPNPGGGLWYSFIGMGEDVTITTDHNGTNYNSRLTVFTGTCDELICVTENDDPGDFATVTFFAASGGYYRILIDGANGAEGFFEMSVDCGNTCTEPLVINCPPNRTVECVADVIEESNQVSVLSPCEEGFNLAVGDPVLAQGFPNCSGTTYNITYTATTDSGLSESCTQIFTIQNAGTQVTIAPDETVECASQISNSLGGVQVTSVCGQLLGIAVTGPVISNPDRPNCNGTTYTYNYSFTDECGENHSYDRVYTIQNTLMVAIGAQLVECEADIEMNLNLINVYTSCNLGYTITVDPNPILLSGLPNCFGSDYYLTLTITDDCGNSRIDYQYFHIDNSGTQATLAPDEIVECAADIFPSENDIEINSPCGLNFPIQISGPVLSNPSGPNCNGTIHTYTYSFTDECGISHAYDRDYTIQNAKVELVKVNPFLADIDNGETVQIQCYALDPNWSIPQFDVADFDATTSCNKTFTIDFQLNDLGAADCNLDGYQHRYEFSWTATDECGTTNQFSFIIELVDEIAPVLAGIPSDVTIECGDALPPMPEIVATDECECAHLTFEEEFFNGVCSSNRTVVRTWTATDHCGNTTQASQNIFIEDTTAPTVYFYPENGSTISNGELVTAECTASEYPSWVFDLDETSIDAFDFCSEYLSITFSLDVAYSNCYSDDYLEKYIPTWTVFDECGNETTFSFTVEVVDNTAPEFYGSEVLYLCEGSQFGWAIAIDECSNESMWSIDEPMEDCGTAVSKRTYFIEDDCGNEATYEQVVVDLTQKPDLITLAAGIDIVGEIYECDFSKEKYTNMSAADAVPFMDCLTDLDINFSEKILQNSCENGGMKLQLLWTATTPCGYIDSMEYLIDIIDNAAPYFPGFQEYIETSCGNGMPNIYALDDCSEVVLDIIENEISSNGCSNEKEIQRTVTATDACGLSTTVTQKVKFVDKEGPVFNAPSSVCSNEVASEIMAYDQCSGGYISATLISENNISSCAANTVLQKTWRATDECGNATDFVQTIYPANYQIELDMLDDGLEAMINGTNNHVQMSNNYYMNILSQVGQYSIIANGPCGELLVGEFSKNIITHDFCVDGVSSTITFNWFFAEVCGTVYEYNVTFYIIDDVLPTLDLGDDINLYCIDVIPELIMAEEEGVDYSIDLMDGRDENGNGVVIRTVTAVDNCGNTTEASQHFNFYNTSNLQCAIEGDFNPACNSYNNVYTVFPSGGTAPYIIEWTVAGGNCTIETLYGNSAEIYIGFGQAIIRAKVTDANGCITECEATIYCEGTGEAIPYSNGLNSEEQKFELGFEGSQIEVEAFPNPFSDILNLKLEGVLEKNYSIILLNALGKTVYQESVNTENSRSVELSLKNMPSGIYQVLIQGKESRDVLQVVKMKE